MNKSKSLNCLLNEEELSTEFDRLNKNNHTSKSLLNIHLNVNLSWFPPSTQLTRSKSLNELIIHEDHSHQSSCKHVNKQNSMHKKLIDDHNLPKSISDDFFNFLMKFEKNRLRTFKNWPIDFVTPEELSKAGFYYLLQSDLVRCFECKITLFNWEYGDQAIIEHYKNNPKCKLINGYDVGNFAIDKMPLQVLRESIDLDEFKQVQSTDTILNFEDLDDDDEDLIELEYNSYENQKPIDTPSSTFDNLLDFMKNEKNRLKTFDRWPEHLVNKVKPADLAQCGFFYTTIKDKVICAFCKIPAWDWVSTDIPIREHYKHNPECPLLNDEDCSNEPIIKNIRFKDLLIKYQDIGPRYSSSYSDEDEISFPINRNRPTSDEQNNLNVTAYNLDLSEIISKHKYADKFNTYHNRLETFKKWPADSVKKTHLADAGFYYLGFKDQVKCFSCDLSLANWSKLDDPWIEHCKYRSDCEYLILSKGFDFIGRNSKLKNSPSKPTEVVCCGSTASSASSNSSSDIEHTDIEPENEGSISLDDDTKNMCKICTIKVADIVYLPCKHLASCNSCTIALKDCPLCKKNIIATMKIYIG